MPRQPWFGSAPQSGKLAVSGQWEQAVVFSPGDFGTEPEVRELLRDDHDVACEAFFGEAFFGVRRRGLVHDLALFVVTFAKALGSARSGGEFFTAISDGLGIPLARDFEFAELGAEGAWGSVGPLRIDDPGMALAHMDRTWGELRSSAVGSQREYSLALEFSFDNGDGTAHWFALPVSHDGRIARGAVEDALRYFCRTRTADGRWW